MEWKIKYEVETINPECPYKLTSGNVGWTHPKPEDILCSHPKNKPETGYGKCDEKNCPLKVGD